MLCSKVAILIFFPLVLPFTIQQTMRIFQYGFNMLKSSLEAKGKQTEEGMNLVRSIAGIVCEITAHPADFAEFFVSIAIEDLKMAVCCVGKGFVEVIAGVIVHTRIGV